MFTVIFFSRGRYFQYRRRATSSGLVI